MPTSTRLGLHSYVAGDAPAGHTQQAQLVTDAELVVAGFLQSVIGSRPAAATANKGYLHWATDTLRLTYSTGSAWIDFSAGEIGGTAFPVSPVNGQRVTLAVAESLQVAGNIGWQFVYDSSLGDASKWKFAGGAPVAFEAAAPLSLTSNNTLSYSGSPGLVLPFAGYYELDYGAIITPGSGAVDIMTALRVDGSVVDQARAYAANTQPYSVPPGKIIVLTSAVNKVADIGVAVSSGSTSTVSRRWITARPVRVTP